MRCVLVYNEVMFSRKGNNDSTCVFRIPTCLCEHTYVCMCVGGYTAYGVCI